MTHDDDLDPLDQAWDLIAEGDLAGALASALESLRDDEDSPEGHNVVGYVYAMEGNLEQALRHYLHALSVDDGFLDALLNATDVLIQLGETERALGLLEDALDVAESPEERAEALLLQVDALLSAGRREEAAEVVGTLPDGPFENPQLDFLVGRARFEVGDLEGAAPLLELAARRPGAHGDAHYYRALVLEERDDPAGMAAAFVQCRDADLEAPRPAWAEPIPVFERRVGQALRRLPRRFADRLEGALVIVDDVPGAELVSEGFDPRAVALVEEVELPRRSGDPVRLCRVFVYQRNAERAAGAQDRMDDELLAALQHEMSQAFPEDR
ncbi:MAG: tetratricopeptide repeat protein [Myxococcota bacterium]